jgi:hypothetical protein
MRVAVLDDYHRVFDADPSIARLRRRIPVDVFNEKITSLEKLKDYPVLIGLRERTRFDAAFFERLPSLELIAQTGNHAYHVDVAAATRAGVLIAMASSDLEAMGAVARSTIELTFGLMLAVMRRIPQTDQAMRRGEWPSFAGRTLAGKKLGIVGLGRIGREVAALARAFGMEILAWGPRSRRNAPRSPKPNSWSSMPSSRLPISSPCTCGSPTRAAACSTSAGYASCVRTPSSSTPRAAPSSTKKRWRGSWSKAPSPARDSTCMLRNPLSVIRRCGASTTW